jgi:hypothetical protein
LHRYQRKHRPDVVAAQAKEEATDAINEAQRRKVLLFSFFADTVQYVRDFLRREVENNPALAVYRNRVVAVTGDDNLEEISRQEAIYGFAPVSTEAPPGRDADLYDILVTTDVLAEGVKRRIGVLLPATADDPEFQARVAAFHQGLQQSGVSAMRSRRMKGS